MKKAKVMKEVKAETQKTEPKKAHITLVKPAETAREGAPGVGCRPTGVQ